MPITVGGGSILHCCDAHPESATAIATPALSGSSRFIGRLLFEASLSKIRSVVDPFSEESRARQSNRGRRSRQPFDHGADGYKRNTRESNLETMNPGDLFTFLV
ncbi:MAG: hypothetical protein DMF00_02600 [Verrucomicrobia bacterium]|nr:MAG: hypothetical protein DMF00_02600 [Verrucomicrobiota bacterium]